MSFQEKNITVTLINFSLILGFFLFRVIQMILGGSFLSSNVFRLWGIVIVLAVVVTIAATILTHMGAGILAAIRTQEEPEIESVQDERDRLIDLRGTRATYSVYSIVALIAMLTYALGQPALVMFTLLIFFGVLAQIVGDITPLYLYRRGF